MSSYDSDPSAYYIPFTSDEKAGVIVTAIVAVVSLLSVLGVLIHIFLSNYTFNKHRRGREVDRPPFLQLQVGTFIVCLLISDLVQGISGIIQIKWAADGGITQGPICVAQGVMLQSGDNGTVVWNAIIAIHTFSTLVLGKRFPPWLVTVSVATGWALVALLSFIGPAAIADPAIGPFYGRAKSWCFIAPEYAFIRIMLHCLPMALSATLIFSLYFLVFLSLRGHLVVEGSSWTFYRKPVSRLTDLNKLANKMLWYPMAYAILCAPITVTRITALELTNVPTGAWIFSMCFLFAMGTCDTIIYSLTRNLGPAPSWLPTRFTHKPQNSLGGASDIIKAMPHDFKSFNLASPTSGRFSPNDNRDGNVPNSPRSGEMDYPSTPNSATKFAVAVSSWPHFDDYDVEEGYEEGQEIVVRPSQQQQQPQHLQPPQPEHLGPKIALAGQTSSEKSDDQHSSKESV